MATGDYEGRILIWRLSTGSKQMEVRHEADRHEAAVDKVLWLVTHTATDASELLLLLSAGGDGRIRVWRIAQPPQLLTTFDGAHGRFEQATSMRRNDAVRLTERILQVSAFSEGRHHVVLGDTAGHVRVFDISAGIDISTDRSVRRSFYQETHLV